VPLAGIATIELRDGAKAPAGAAAGAIVLTDGTIFNGHFVNLNLGVVETDAGDVDRAEVALIVLEPAPAADLVVFADGKQKNGKLTTCDAASCRLDGELIPLQKLRWIGLAEEGSAPPDAEASGNQVWVDDEPVDARMSSVDATNVGTTHGKFARTRVSWIHIAAAAEDKPAGGAGTAQEAPAPAPPTAPPPPSAQPPGGHTGGTPSAPPAPRTGTRGALWSGMIRGRLWGTVDGTRSTLNTTVRARLREYLVPWHELGTGRQIGTIRLLRSEGSEIQNTFRCSGEGLSCSGNGSVTIDTRDDDGQPSVIYLKTRDGRADFELPVGKELYVVGIPAHSDSTYDVTYRTLETSVVPMSFMSPLVGWQTFLPRVPATDPQLRYVENGRMSGSFTTDAVGAFQHITVSWMICREGVQCSEPPPLPEGGDGSTPPPAADDCAELSQLTEAMRQLKETYDGFEDDYKKASADRDAVRDHIWGFNGALRKYFTAMLSLAGQGASGALAKAISVSKTLMNMSGEGDVGDVIKATKAIATDPLKDAAAKAAVKAAVAQADAYLAQTGDEAGALRTYAVAIGKSEKLASAGAKLAKGVNIANALADYTEKTSGLADLIQEWLDHNEAANRAQTQMDDINRRMEELQKRIDACRRGSSPARRDVQLAAFYAAAAATGSGDPASIAARLSATRTRLEAIPSQLEAAAPWLLPFFADAPMSARLAAALLGKAVPQLEAVQKTLDDAVAEGQSMESELQQAIPPKAGAAKGGGGAATR
jgi:hypothetical protein